MRTTKRRVRWQDGQVLRYVDRALRVPKNPKTAQGLERNFYCYIKVDRRLVNKLSSLLSLLLINIIDRLNTIIKIGADSGYRSNISYYC